MGAYHGIHRRPCLCFLSQPAGLGWGPSLRSLGGPRRQTNELTSKQTNTTLRLFPPPRPTATLQEVAAYWDEVLEGVDKPTARKLLPFIDTSQPLGLRAPAALPGGTTGGGTTGSTTSTGRKARAPLYQYHVNTKKEHPTKVGTLLRGRWYCCGRGGVPACCPRESTEPRAPRFRAIAQPASCLGSTAWPS